MSDFNYSLAKDSTKSVPLYHHEQVPFQSFYRQSNNGNNVNHNNNTNHTVSPLLNNTVKSADQNNNPASGDLQDIIYSYQTQPELLKLILSSKLEEDKRRAEEAKLKAKELDLLLIQQQQQMPLGNTHHANGNHPNYNNNSNNNNHNNNNHNSNNNNNNNNNNDNHHHHDIANLFQTPLTNTFVQSTPPISQGSSADGKMYQTIRRTSLDAILSTPLLPSQQQQQQQRIQHRRNSNLDSSFTADSDELEDQTFSPISTSTTTPVSTSSLLHMDSYHSAVMSSLNSKSLEDENAMMDRHRIQSQRYNVPPKPRRRREMQAITKIVETREYPYVDGYFWKNNGNTVQKKTGNKSVYYKCSNSNKGCPVNKTVTWKNNDEYLIKYRGEHLLECNKVQRIVDM